MRSLMVTFRIGLALALAVTVAVPLAGCQTDAETVQTLMKARQEEWARELRALGAQEQALWLRLARTPESGGRRGAGASVEGRDPQPSEATARQLRVSSVLAGSRQALVDLDLTIKEAARSTAGVLARDPKQAMTLLDAEQARVTGVLRMLRDQLASTERDVGAIGKS